MVLVSPVTKSWKTILCIIHSIDGCISNRIPQGLPDNFHAIQSDNTRADLHVIWATRAVATLLWPLPSTSPSHSPLWAYSTGQSPCRAARLPPLALCGVLLAVEGSAMVVGEPRYASSSACVGWWELRMHWGGSAAVVASHARAWGGGLGQR